MLTLVILEGIIVVVIGRALLLWIAGSRLSRVCCVDQIMISAHWRSIFYAGGPTPSVGVDVQTVFALVDDADDRCTA